jgi:hypothetical protein
MLGVDNFVFSVRPDQTEYEYNGKEEGKNELATREVQRIEFVTKISILSSFKGTK